MAYSTYSNDNSLIGCDSDPISSSKVPEVVHGGTGVWTKEDSLRRKR